MIETDPTSIEGNWRLADDEAPDTGSVFTLRDGHVFNEGVAIGAYVINGSTLTFKEVDEHGEGAIRTTTYTFDLPGPLADPASPSLLGTEIVRPSRLSGNFEWIDSVGFGEDDEFYDTCVFIRID